MSEPTDVHLSRAEFWQRAAGLAFGLWALMVPLGVAMVRSAVEDIVRTQQDQIVTFNAYVLGMERRMTLMEERQARTMSALEAYAERLGYIEGRTNGRGGR